MINSNGITKIHKESFIANLYSSRHFRMIGLIDVDIHFFYGIERVTLAYYSSSGTNNGKIKGLWYPIVGIKTYTGLFTEFPEYINMVLTRTAFDGTAKKGWLAKSLFFYDKEVPTHRIRGFTNGRYYDALLNLGETLRDWYDVGQFQNDRALHSLSLNKALASPTIYPGNSHSQQVNFIHFIADLYNEAL